MTGYYPAEAIRAAERATGPLLTDGILMARAAHAVATTVLAELAERTGSTYGRSVLLLVGAGDNGGDALYAARLLRRRGVAVAALLTSPKRTHAAGLADFQQAGGQLVTQVPPTVDVAVDAIVGLGGSGPLREPAVAWIAELAARSVPIVAVDLPSGIDPDTGVVHERSVRADVCVTFSLPRLAHLLAAPSCGRIIVADIGIPRPAAPAIMSPSDAEIAVSWPVPGPLDDKYTQGVVGVMAGSARYPGAAVLSVGAAITATSGLTRYVGPAADRVVNAHPEVVASTDLAVAGRVQAWIVGPGMGTNADSTENLRSALHHDVPVVVDADALTIAASESQIRQLIRDRTAPTLLTPHAGEFARVAAAAGSRAAELLTTDRRAAVIELARDLDATVLLKGRITLIATPNGRVWGADAQSSWAATAGSGDLLAGIVGALLASGLDAPLAAHAAARLHARAAMLASGGAPIGASTLLNALRPALRDLLGLRQ